MEPELYMARIIQAGPRQQDIYLQKKEDGAERRSKSHMV